MAINGTAGNDRLKGTFSSESFNAGDGDDIILGGGGVDVVDAGAGDDLINASGQIDGGDGVDTLYFVYSQLSAGVDPVDFDLAITTARKVGGISLQLSSVENAFVRNELSAIRGTEGDNYLAVLSGSMFGRGGNDVLSVSSLLQGTTYDGGDGIDILMVGSDLSTGSPVVLSLAVASSQYTLVSIENLGGGGKADSLTGNDGDNILAGAGGNDRLMGGAGNDSLYGDGRWMLPLVDTGDYTYPRFGRTTLVENLPAVAGDDQLEGGAGDDLIVGGGGIDTAIYAHASAAVTVDLVKGTASGGDGNDTLRDIENVVGSAYVDRLIGNDAANLLDGGKGADTMIGGLGDDIYVIDNKGDVVVEEAGGGNDTVRANRSYAAADNIENVILTGSANIDATGDAGANVLAGNAGINVLTGGAGDDVYVVQNEGDRVVEGVDGGIDTVRVTGIHVMGDNVENAVLVGYGHVTGNALDNRIEGSKASDIIDGGVGADTMIGGNGADIYYVDNVNDRVIETGTSADEVRTTVSYTLGKGLERLVLLDGAIVGIGNDGINTITGNDADNILDGKYGRDTLIGGKGDDSYYVSDMYENVIENPDEGIDTAYVTFGSYILGANIENGASGSTGGIDIAGNDLDNTLTGGIGNDSFNGRGGHDTLAGGKGDDSYTLFDDGDDVVVEEADEGYDILYVANDAIMPDNVEELDLEGLSHDGTGNALDNTIVGNSLDNVLDGKGGDDLLIGRGGTDIFYVDSAGDRIEDAGGMSEVFASVSYALGDSNVYKLTLTGRAVRGVGNGVDNLLIGTDATNQLDGLQGNDTMRGGKGNDVYWVDAKGDVVDEKINEGTDTVRTSIDYVLPGNVENGAVEGAYGLVLAGNGLANVLTGGVEADTLRGGGGRDVLRGGAGNDVLDGGAGADRMDGGAGFNTFRIDNAGDIAIGDGEVRTSISWTLADQRDLVLLGSAALDGIGNARANHLVGNDAANALSGLDGNDVLDGGGGADKLVGGSGDDLLSGGDGNDRMDAGDGNDLLDGGLGGDTLDGGPGDDVYIVDSTGDVVTEVAGAGRDTIISSIDLTMGANVEITVASGNGAVALTGNALDNLIGGNEAANRIDGGDGQDTLYGLGGDDILRGGAGDDVLVGGFGDDALTGGAGADTFVVAFNSDGSDTIADFVSGQDRLVVVNPYVSGILLSGGFRLGTAAQDADDLAIYDKATGRLYADLDGNGAGEKILVATFAAGTDLKASDIQLLLTDDFTAQVSTDLGLLAL